MQGRAKPLLEMAASWAVSAAAVLGLALVARAEPAAQATLRGRATVVDGDGLEIGATKVRLFGIDAPEIGQYCVRSDGTRWRCGHYASVALDRATVGQIVVCKRKATDSYGRTVAVCSIGGTDLGARQVRAGWALAYRRFSHDYVEEELAARSGRAGMWQGTFEPPWRWRERMRKRK